MPTFAEQKQRYMLTGSGEAAGPQIYTNCLVEPLIQDQAMPSATPTYFARLCAQIAALGTGETTGQFIYIAGWWLGADFSLPGSSGTRLTDLLIQKVRAGVDVRVLGWVMPPETLQSSTVQGLPAAQSILQLNSQTMRFINALRSEPSLADKACLNILSHPAGAVHLKMCIVGDNQQATGYTGGLDFENFRHDPAWHDVQAAVTGPAVQSLFDLFRQLWNEVRSRPPAANLSVRGITCDSHSRSMPDLPARTIASASTGRMHVQSAVTLPQFVFGGGSLTGAALPRNQPLRCAPNGQFDIKAVWQKGISGAQNYIYMEDQAFTSAEVFDWVNTALRDNFELKVVIVVGGDDPTAPSPTELLKAHIEAVNGHLLTGLSSADIAARVAYCKHKVPGKFVHTKSTLIDDAWAIIGSANCMRRSLYTDFEHSVAYMDENGQGVPNYRSALWATVLQQTVASLPESLARFFAIPFRGTSGAAANHTLLDRLQLPLPGGSLTADERVIVDEVLDVDSRQRWGDRLIALYVRQHGAGSFSP